ncbi:MAG TPA: 3-phosphoglycerate dehydrogenase [Candidatus Acetothermia bacterium]|nr:3-phosphoglycerate dehydrogenase [Candidatus Acetothermia bacterium]
MTFKVLVSDPLAKSAVAQMREAGLTVDEKTDLSIEQLKKEIANYDAIVVRSATKLRAEIIDAATNLKLIVRAGVGLDNIDVDYAKEKGINVRNTPAASSNSVAELALGHMISLARYISRGTVSVKGGKWEKKALKGIEIDGKTLGIVGIGRIGQSLAKKATALGMSVIAYDKFVDESPLPEIVKMVPFDRLLAESDFISLHIPFDPKVGAAIGKAEISKMKDGVRLLNCARGGVIDEGALAAALASGKVGGAALDVFAVEPPASDNPLLAQENVSFTPHIGASTVEAQGRVGAEAAATVIEFARSN